MESRAVDTVYTGRSGPLEIAWPDRGIKLTLDCAPALATTMVYSPRGGDFFCVEPVTHMTDAFNRGQLDGLEPGARRVVHVRFTANLA